MKKGLKFTKEQLKRLYLTEGLSLSHIGNEFGCEATNILYWLKKFNIKRRPAYRKKIHIPKDVLDDLYWNKGLRPREIAKKFSIKNEGTVRKKLKKYGIKRKTVSEALTTKFKAPFSGNLSEKAFLLGLRAGDFHTKWARKSVRVQTTTTHEAQIELLLISFEKYGETRKYLSRNSARADEWFIYTDLDSSFDFLLDKPQEIPSWIMENRGYFYNFLAAYCDCESNWHFAKNHENDWRFVFRLRTGDKKILEQIKNKFEEENLKPLFRLDVRKGIRPKWEKKFNVSIYNITLNRKADIFYLIDKMLPLSKHSEKIRKMNFILKHKYKKWDEIEPLLKKLKKEIKKEILTDSPS